MAFRLLAYLQGECQLVSRLSKCLTTMMFAAKLSDAPPRALWSCWNYLPQAR